jgi:hypothetical protein
MLKRTAALLALAALLSGAASQDGDIKVEDAGFGFLPAADVLNFPRPRAQGLASKFIGKFDTWTPFQAVLVNDGPPRDGILTVRPYYAESGDAITYSRRVSLPRDGRKRITFPVRATYEPMSMSFRDDNAGAVRLDGERHLAIPQPRIASPATEIVLLASDTRIPYSHLVFPRRRTDQPNDRLLVVVAPDQLPQTALEYDAVGLLILDDIAADALTPAQASAIHQWVCRGGALVMTLLRNAHRIKGTQLEPLLAGPLGDVRNVKSLKAFEEATTFPCVFDVETAVQSFNARDGADGDPMLLGRRIERGVSVSCGLPLSSTVLEPWPRAPHLIDAFLRSNRRAWLPLPGGTQARFREIFAPALKGAILKSVPPFKAVVILMTVYVVAVVVLPYAVMRPFRRLELAWIGVVGLALAGSGIVYGVGIRYLRNDSVACRVTLVEGGGVPGPHLRHNFWSLFSARGGVVNLAFENPPVVPFPFGRELGLRGAGSASEPLQAAFDADAQIRSFPTYAQDSVLFETTDTVSLSGQIGFQVENFGAALRGRVTVDAAFPLREAWIVYGSRVVSVRPGPFEIPAGDANADFLGTLLERNGFEAVTRYIREREWGGPRPLLLYRYEGTPSLASSEIKEDAIHFGVIESSNWSAEDISQVHWSGVVRMPADTDAEVEAVEFAFRTRHVPPGAGVEHFYLGGHWSYSGRGASIELYDRVNEQWVGATVTSDLMPFVYRSPLGGLAIQARFRGRNYLQSFGSSFSELQLTANSRLRWNRP